MKIAFAPIDARDGVVGYDTVGFVAPQKDGWEEYRFPASREMYVLCERMQAEYLTRLYALQQEIIAKYAPLAVEDQFTDDYEVRDAVEGPIYEAVERQVKQEFPGERAEYYT